MKMLVQTMILLFCVQTAHAFQCNECHSKNPAMVRMHKALQGRGCFDCHKMGEKLMGKGVPRDKTAQLQRRLTDPICAECHKK
jgi:hypothetical protein